MATFGDLINEMAGEHGLKVGEDKIYPREKRLAHVNEAREEFSRAYPRLKENRVEGTLVTIVGQRAYAKPDRHLATLMLFRLGDDGVTVTNIVHVPDLPTFRWMYGDIGVMGTVRHYAETADDKIVLGYVPAVVETLQFLYLAAAAPVGDGDSFDALQNTFAEAIKMRALLKSGSWLETPPEQVERWEKRLALAERGMATRMKSLEFEDVMIRRKQPGWFPTRTET